MVTIISIIAICISVFCILKQRKKTQPKPKVLLKYHCPACGSDIQVLKRTDYNMYFNCSNPYCFNHGWGSEDLRYMDNHAQVIQIQERVPNPDNIKDWDIVNAKDAEIVAIKEVFKRKGDLL